MANKRNARAKLGVSGAAEAPKPPPPPAPRRPVVEFVYRFDPSNPYPEHYGARVGEASRRPATPDEASHRLIAGNAVFADFMAACNRESEPGHDHAGGAMGLQFVRQCDGLEVGLGDGRQDPFAAVLGCVDARVPIELALGQEFDDLLTIRTAGNTLIKSGEAMGSLHFALANYAPRPARPDTGALAQKGNIRLILVLGHTDCGAVKAAFEGFSKRPPEHFFANTPPALFSILWEISKAVKFVMHHKASIGDDETTLKDAISYVNAAMTARRIDEIRRQMVIKGLLEDGALEVRFGLFDVTDHRIAEGALIAPPADNAAMLRGVKAFVDREAGLRIERAGHHPVG